MTPAQTLAHLILDLERYATLDGIEWRVVQETVRGYRTVEDGEGKP